MPVLFLISFILSSAVVSSISGEAENDCPPWMAFKSGVCLCRDLHDNIDTIFCDPKTQVTYTVAGTCVTYANSTNREIVIGDCPYVPAKHVSYEGRFLTALPQNESLLNDVMCGPFNRQNLLCSSCRPGYGISVYSFGHPCAKCDSNHLGVLWYVLLELLPTSVLYIIVVLFSIRATSAPLVGLVFFSHVVVNVMRGRIALYISLMYSTNRFTYVLIQTSMFLSGIWNLDYFRFISPPFCVSEAIGNIHAVVLEYVSALYPLVLVFFTFLMIELHAHNVRPVVWLWKPFHKCFVHFNRSWNIKHSTITAFSTFLLLSYTKVIFVSFGLLYKAFVYNGNGTVISQSLTFDPKLQNFGTTHSPFALIAIIIIIVFTVPPILLLALYPTRLFQKSLRCCRCRATQAVHMFVDTYQGCFKDGTNGTRDYRALSVVYLLLRFALISLYIQDTEVVTSGLSLFMFSILFMLISLFLGTVKPYKHNYMTYCESALLFNLGVLALLVYVWLFFPTQKNAYATVIGILSVLPHITLICYLVFIIFRGKAVLQWIKKHNPMAHFSINDGVVMHILRLLKRFRSPSTSLLIEEDTLPDRLLHPDEYPDTLSTDYKQVDLEESST